MMLMLPLFVTLETAPLGNLEHGNQQWNCFFALPAPRPQLLGYVALAYLASRLIVSIHTRVGWRWRSFVVASAVMVIAILLFQSDLSDWYPWTLPGLVVYGLEEGLFPAKQLLVGCLGSLAVALLAGMLHTVIYCEARTLSAV